MRRQNFELKKKEKKKMLKYYHVNDSKVIQTKKN